MLSAQVGQVTLCGSEDSGQCDCVRGSDLRRLWGPQRSNPVLRKGIGFVERRVPIGGMSPWALTVVHLLNHHNCVCRGLLCAACRSMRVGCRLPAVTARPGMTMRWCVRHWSRHCWPHSGWTLTRKWYALCRDCAICAVLRGVVLCC